MLEKKIDFWVKAEGLEKTLLILNGQTQQILYNLDLDYFVFSSLCQVCWSLSSAPRTEEVRARNG